MTATISQPWSSVLDEVLEAVPAVLRGELRRQRQVVQRHAHRPHRNAGRAERLHVAAGGRAQAKRMAEIAGQADRQARPPRPRGGARQPDRRGVAARPRGSLAGGSALGGPALGPAPGGMKRSGMESSSRPNAQHQSTYVAAVGAVEVGIAPGHVRAGARHSMEDGSG